MLYIIGPYLDNKGRGMVFSNHSYPCVLNGEFGYFQAVYRFGYFQAHGQMLRELKAWLGEHKPYLSSFAEAAEAYRVHRSFARLVLSDRETPCTLRELDRIFIEVFGFSGRALVEGDLPRTRAVPETRVLARRPIPASQPRAASPS